MIINFTDNDFAVIQDSLGTNRERIRGMDMATPNMDETMGKWGRWAKPSGCEFTVVTGQDVAAIASREVLSIVLWSIIENTSATGLEQACEALSKLPVAAEPDAARLLAVMQDEIDQRRAAAQ